MGLIWDDDLAGELDEIFRAQKGRRFYKWSLDLNNQFDFLEEKMARAGIEFVVEKVRQNCDNLHVTVKADPDQVAWMDMSLLVWCHRKGVSHLLVLEHSNLE